MPMADETFSLVHVDGQGIESDAVAVAVAVNVEVHIEGQLM
jgi:hypothetical protein